MTRNAKQYVVKPLGKRQVMQAYPLVQTAVPQLTLEQWMTYASSLCKEAARKDAGSGVMTAQNRDGYIYGIYCHDIETDIEHGRVLKVSNLVAANLYDSAGIMDRMIDSMMSVARGCDCAAVHVDLPENMNRGPQPVEGVSGRLRGAGYRATSVGLYRSLEKSEVK